jgi:hypothetical protein
VSLPRTILDSWSAGLVRDWWLDVLVDGVWVAVNGIANFAPAAPVATEAIAPLSSDGWDFPVKSGMGWSLQVSLWRKPTPDATPVYDPGQEALRNAAEDMWGAIPLRWYKMDVVRSEAYAGTGIVEYSQAGGDVGSVDGANVTITGQGARTRINHPAPV